ncbi:MAG: ADP-ribosylation factor-like protein [Promethearchaeota archaeon]
MIAVVNPITQIPGTTYGARLKKSEDGEFLLELFQTGRLINTLEFSEASDLKRVLKGELERLNQFIPNVRLENMLKDILSTTQMVKGRFARKDLVSTTMEAVLESGRANITKILIAGLDGAGKTAIFHTVFRKANPFSLEPRPTKGKKSRTFRSKFWECEVVELGGNKTWREYYRESGEREAFEGTGVFIFVVDALDMGRFEEAKEYFAWTHAQFKEANPKGSTYVFVHKIDKTFFSPFTKVRDELSAAVGADQLEVFSTSIFNQSISLAFSVIFTRIFPKTTYLTSVLDNLSRHKLVDYAMIILRRTGLICASSIKASESHEEDELNEAGLIFLEAAERVTKLFFKHDAETITKLVLETSKERLLIKEIDRDSLLLVKFSGNIGLYGESDREVIRKVIPQIQDILSQY